VAYQITAEDLMAVSMLSVRVVRYYALHVLDYRDREISGLLAQIPVDVKLVHRRCSNWPVRRGMLHGASVTGSTRATGQSLKRSNSG
jgi:hypothetical protein